MRSKKSASKPMRLMSSWRSIDGHTQRWSRKRFQSSPAFMGPPSGLGGGQDRLALRLDRCEQFLEGVDELLHALVLELLRGGGQVDADLPELRDRAGRVVDALPDPRGGLAVVAVRLHGLHRHRVDRVGPDERL